MRLRSYQTGLLEWGMLLYKQLFRSYMLTGKLLLESTVPGNAYFHRREGGNGVVENFLYSEIYKSASRFTLEIHICFLMNSHENGYQL